MCTHGLTLGKYAPLHKGHQLVIDTAIKDMDRVSVMIYDAPETTSIPLNVRAGWLRSLYPSVNVIEAWDGPTQVGDTPEIKQVQENYVLNVLKIRGITHFYSSEFYGDHMSRALGAENRLVDTARSSVPVSGTRIRENPYALTFVCDADVPYDNTWDRSGDANRQVFQKQIIADLLVRRVPFFVLKGSVEERIVAVRSVLSSYQKYMNAADLGRASASGFPASRESIDR